MRLLSVQKSIQFYEAISFEQNLVWEIAGMFRIRGAPPLQRGRSEVALGALKEAAHRFESSEECNVRAPGSSFSVKSHALCVVMKSQDGNGVDAAAWVVPNGYFKSSEENHMISLSPVVARSPSLAREVVSDAIAIWEEENPVPGGIEVRCQVLKQGGHGQAVEMFASLGFVHTYSSPLMRRALGTKPCPPLPAPSDMYYAINRS